MRIRTIIAAAAAPLALGGVLLTSTAASAAPKAPATVYATTYEHNVDDTFSPSGPWTGPVDPTGNGPIWAYDNVERQLVATQQADGSWKVDLYTIGEYNAFANPVTGQYPLAHSFSGLTVSSSTWTVPAGYTPSKANMPAQTDPSFRSQNVVSELFGGGANGVPVSMITGTGNWNYFGVPGASYDGVPGWMHQSG